MQVNYVHNNKSQKRDDIFGPDLVRSHTILWLVDQSSRCPVIENVSISKLC